MKDMIFVDMRRNIQLPFAGWLAKCAGMALASQTCFVFVEHSMRVVENFFLEKASFATLLLSLGTILLVQMPIQACFLGILGSIAVLSGVRMPMFVPVTAMAVSLMMQTLFIVGLSPF